MKSIAERVGTFVWVCFRVPFAVLGRAVPAIVLLACWSNSTVVKTALTKKKKVKEAVSLLVGKK